MPSAGAVQVVVPSVRGNRIGRVLSGLQEESLIEGTLVVDDTLDGSVAPIAQRYHVTVLRSSGRGQGTARNIGASAARAEWILFLDDDVVIPQGFGESVRRAIAAAPASTGLIECAVRPIGRAMRPYWRRRIVGTRGPGGFLTACLIVRRSAFLRVGGLAGVTRGALREDTELGIRILRTGATAVWVEDVFVQHPIEDIGLRSFLRTATFFRADAVFHRRYPGYLAHVGQAFILGPVRFGGFRRRLSLAAFGGFTLALVGGRVDLAAGWALTLGTALNVVHLRAIRQSGVGSPAARDIVRPEEVCAHTAWALTAGASQTFGYLQLLARTQGPDDSQRSITAADALIGSTPSRAETDLADHGE